jgi:hypothetical protein
MIDSAIGRQMPLKVLRGERLIDLELSPVELRD